MTSKYYDKIEQYQKERESQGDDQPLPDFDFQKLAAKNAFSAFIGRLIEKLIPLILWVCRKLFPVAHFAGFYWITRKADVEAALTNYQVLEVPYGREMLELSLYNKEKAPFVLGLDGPDQQRQNAIIRKIVLKFDIPKLSEWSSEYAEALIEGGDGRLDVITDLAIRVPTEICRRYFGLEFLDANRFAEWSMAVSALLFADPNGDRTTREQAIAGAARLSRIIDIAIGRELPNAKNFPPQADQTLVQRLIVLAQSSPELKLERPEVRAILLGLIVGFIPTNGLAGSKMLEVLVGRGDAFRAAKKAALEEDYKAMEHIALEAGRLNPALAPGQWRYANQELVVHGKTIPKGSTVMVSTMSGLHDTSSPFSFKSDRQTSPELIFGHATHKCIGQHVAIGVITPIFLKLFSQPKLRRAPGRLGRMQHVGFLPNRLDMEYESISAVQTMIVACVPVADSEKATELKKEVEKLQNPARKDVATTLDDTGIVHFASCSVVNNKDADAGPFTLILEFNIDGPRDAALVKLEALCGVWLKPILLCAQPNDTRRISEILSDYCIDLHGWPWGVTGLNFFGVAGRSVKRVDGQAALRLAAEQEVRRYLQTHGGNNAGLHARALLVLNAVRRALRNRKDLGGMLIEPSRKRNEMSQWRPPENLWQPLSRVLRTRFVIGLMVAFALTWLLFGILVDMTLNRANPADQSPWIAVIGRFGVTAIIGLAMAGLVWALGLWLLWSAFLRAEKKEALDERMPVPENLAEIVKRENAAGYLQNHIIAVTPLKKGLLRRLALALGLWGIAQSLNWFRPGFVVTMGTIHFAKWFRMPNSRKLIFQSNYDGSWESYLEDFVTRAHQGQTAAWSNGEGFPRSRGLVDEGAQDGDRFKRWVRRQQIPTSFWYSRFPNLTAKEQRSNALLQDGLARAQSDTAARSWLDLIGSAQRQPYELESLDVQSLIFRGLKKALFTACIPIRLPEKKEAVGGWLDEVIKGLSFGKFPDGDTAQYLAFSAAGIRRIQRHGDASNYPVNLLAKFPGAFATGMGSRGAILGDPEASPKDGRRWTDLDSPEATGRAVDAVLLVYAPDRNSLQNMVDAHIARLKNFDGGVVHQVIKTVQLNKDQEIAEQPQHGSYEHFGFRDGISSPVIRGAEQFLPDADERDVVEAGEFILGYRNNQGYFSPPITVPASSDGGEHLPVAPDGIAFGFADFHGSDGLFADRDFGRNGAFIAIRQLKQEVESFQKFTDAAADTLNVDYGPNYLRDTVGDAVTGKWIAAKMMGRWQDGRPLIGNPTEKPQTAATRPANDFLFGRDDPRGHACPLGAHVRRANPRDSLEPEDPLEQTISKRHQMLRRGRTYFYDGVSKDYPNKNVPPDAEKGLLFVAICADLERQFEIVMQTWLGFPSFHGLTDEPDPISTSDASKCVVRKFTIPTAAGPLTINGLHGFVELHGGGYFFLPSRSTLNYLRSLSSPPEIPLFSI